MDHLKRSAAEAGLEDLSRQGEVFDSDDSRETDEASSHGSRSGTPESKSAKKTRGRVKINMEFIDNKLRRYTTFSKRKSGIMKKAHELATLTGTQVMLLVASETGHVYTFATRKLQPILSSDAGKQLIQTCLNSPDLNDSASPPSHQDDQRMSAQGFEEPELSCVPPDDSKDGLLQKTYHILNAMSAQQHERSPTPQQRFNPDTHTLSSVSLAPSSSSDSDGLKAATERLQGEQPFTLVPPQTVPSHFEQTRLHLAASAAATGVRMQMIPVTHDRPSSSLMPSDQSNAHVSTIDEKKLAFLNSYGALQHSVTSVPQLLVAGASALQIPNTQVAVFRPSDDENASDR